MPKSWGDLCPDVKRMVVNYVPDAQRFAIKRVSTAMQRQVVWTTRSFTLNCQSNIDPTILSIYRFKDLRQLTIHNPSQFRNPERFGQLLGRVALLSHLETLSIDHEKAQEGNKLDLEELVPLHSLTELNITHCDLSGSMSHLMKLLENQDELQVVRLRGLGPLPSPPIGALQKHTQLREVILDSCLFSRPDEVSALITMLQRSVKLRKFKLYGTQKPRVEGLTRELDLLGNLSQSELLETFHFRVWNLHLARPSDLPKKYLHLRSLELCLWQEKKEPLELIISSLENLKQLRHLFIWYDPDVTGLDDFPFLGIFAKCKVLDQLEKLGLVLGEAMSGGDELCKRVGHMNRLKKLSLDGVSIGREGIEIISEMLGRNAPMKKLSLKNANIDNEKAEKLLQALRQNRTLVALDLEFNQLTEELLVPICEMAKSNHSLRLLNVAENEISQEDVDAQLKKI